MSLYVQWEKNETEISDDCQPSLAVARNKRASAEEHVIIDREKMGEKITIRKAELRDIPKHKATSRVLSSLVSATYARSIIENKKSRIINIIFGGE